MVEWLYADRILYVDLSTGVSRAAATSIELKREYVGGAGFVARLLTETAPGGPGIVMAAGPLSDGVAGRLAMGASVRLQGSGRAFSSMGGKMAAGLKAAGYDALVLTGRLERPGYLVVLPDRVEIRPADEMWGLDVPAAEEVLAREAGAGYAYMVAGPAAENGVSFATLVHDGHCSGGSGVAAALGRMQVKALLLPDPGVPSRCTGCTLACPSRSAPETSRAGELGLDGPTAARLAALARGCVRAGLLPPVMDPLAAIAHRIGVGEVLAEGEAALLSRLGPEAERILAELPGVKRRGGPGLADLLGTCQRLFRERPGGVLREALTATVNLMSFAD